MTNKEKIKAIYDFIDKPLNIEERYYDLLEQIGGLKRDYCNYMSTEPVDCDKELQRIPTADYELCTAILTMLLREDHFDNGSFLERYKEGSVTAVLNRMIETLDKQ